MPAPHEQAAAATAKSGKPLCFLMDEDFAVRQDLARELRRREIDVVEFSSSDRFAAMVEEQNPDIVFVNLNKAAPHECVRALSALKDCSYAGAVQLLGRCEPKLLDSFNIIGADCALAMLPPLTKPLEFTKIHRIFLDCKLGSAVPVASGVSLREALAKNLIRFLYQPKVELKTGTMIGAEMLARVVHPERGLLAPSQFLKGADEEDLVALSRLTLVNAVKMSAHFLESGIALRASINIGIDNLLRLPIADLLLMHRPDRNDWPGVLLEVPERQVAGKIGPLTARFPALQRAGAALAIDNFGSGSFRLAILNQIPFAEIKIDRSLVEGCATNVGNANMCKAIVQTAHSFGSKAVAVGIATEADLQALFAMDCDFGQGYLLGKPLTRQEFDALIANFKGRAA
jgi:EAL domain-containing protein (putative c-di-GMP-specific phosphodiesterase class I)